MKPYLKRGIKQVIHPLWFRQVELHIVDMQWIC